MRKYILVTNDDDHVTVSRVFCDMSAVLRECVACDACDTCDACDACDTCDAAYVPMPLSNVSTETLRHLVTLCDHHCHGGLSIPVLPKPLPITRDAASVFGVVYDTFFAALGRQQLLRLLRAANYLDMPVVQQLCAARVAFDLHCSSPHAIRSYFQDTADA
jgi:hypothetical protein